MRDEKLELREACSFSTMCGEVLEAGAYDVMKTREKQMADSFHRRPFNGSVKVHS